MRNPSAVMLTGRERWAAALAFEPVDHLPFWPKLDRAYPLAQAEPFRSMSLADLHAWLGTERQVGLPNGLRTVAKKGSYAVRNEAGGRFETWTLAGRQHERRMVFDPGSQAWHPVSFPIAGRDDLLRFADWYRGQEPEVDPDGLAVATRRLGELDDDAFPVTDLGESPWMHCVEWLCGVSGAHYLLHDHPAEVAALCDAMQADLLARADLLIAHHPAPVTYLVENTSTTLISPTQYHEINLPQVRAVAERFAAAGKSLMLHMCGWLKALLPDLATLPVTGFEAFTAPPLGNTTLLDGRAACPDKALIGGTHATLWLQPAEAICQFLAARLGELPHHRGLVLSSAGVMPPGCPPETIRAVREWIEAYPVRL